MYEFTRIKDDNDFREARRMRVGASDMPIIAGKAARYGITPLKLWREKTGRDKPFEGNDHTRWGTILEAPVCDEFIKKHELKYYEKKTRFIHPEYQWAICHPDLLYFTNEWRIPKLQQIKICSSFAAKRDDYQPETGYDPDDLTVNGIPESVYIQEQWELFCSGIDEAGVSVLIDSHDYREYMHITYSKKVVEQLFALAERFAWCLENDKEPDPINFTDVKLMYPDIKSESVTVIGGEISERVRKLKEDSKERAVKIKKLKAEDDEAEAAIAILLGDNKELRDETGKKLASQSKHFSGEHVRIKEMTEKEPQLYELIKPYISQTEIRRIYW